MTKSEMLVGLIQAQPAQIRAAYRAVRNGPAAGGKVEPLYLTVAAAAKRIGVSRKFMYKLITLGRVRHIELAPGTKRIPAADLLGLAEDSAAPRERIAI